MTLIDLPEPGLYRTTTALPGSEAAIPANVLVYVGQKPDGVRFVVRPGQNRANRWYWGEPTMALRSPTWSKTLRRLPAEGFYTLPRNLDLEGGGRWLENAIVQLGYNDAGKGILFVAEQREAESANALFFSDRGVMIADELLDRLRWAPILPVTTTKQ
ncbi:MAG: hypothetical protein JW751_25875 [Polyangiaceae bacterium]|nr:hypothetical protein [Polyangiaceae bacterium]